MKPRLAGRFEARLALERTGGGCSVMVAGALCKRLATRAYTRGGMAHAACEACLVRLGAVRAPVEPSGQGGLL